MKCYRHHAADAVGVCKSCNKGVCPDCATDVGDGIACKNSCEQAVKDINEIVLKSKSIYQKTSATYYRLAVIYGLLGSFFIIYPFIFMPLLTSLFLPIGIIFLVGMFFMIYSGIKLKSKEEPTG